MKHRFLALGVMALASAACASEPDPAPAPVAPEPPEDDGPAFDLMFGTENDPTTCDEAAQRNSYVGCDYWPTVNANGVWDVFDFAIAVANVGAETVELTITGPGGYFGEAAVGPKSVAKIILPWVPELKGTDATVCGTNEEAAPTALGNAYHLTTTSPVAVYQFNALEYRGAGGPEGKTWDSCPGYQVCPESGSPNGCFSFSNDASILLPSTAMTGNYRVAGFGAGSHLAITATRDATSISVFLPPGQSVIPGGPVSGSSALIAQTLNAGEVLQLAAASGSDLSGTQIVADQPVQALSGAKCASLGENGTCDHLEESLLPAETLGKRYLVVAPTGPLGRADAQLVRLVGNVDGTQLSYPLGAPPGAPTTIDAGQVVDLGLLGGDLEIVGSSELAVATFLPSASLSNPPDTIQSAGDPSQSQVVAVEQFRESYVFLAPDDYDVAYVDVTAPVGAAIELDGQPIPGEAVPIGGSGFAVTRARLGVGAEGAHAIKADQAIGVQVIGYGAFTSYQYPAGMRLKTIAEPPPPPK